MGTIKGGEKLESYLKELAARMGNAKTVSIGFLEGSTEPDGTSIPMIAAIQEFGAPKAKIPPRPFFRNMIAAKSPGWAEGVATQLKETNYDILKTLSRVGEAVSGQLQESIINTYEPALSPVTVMLRGMKSNDQSLVVTGKTVGEAAARVAAGKTNYGASTKPLVDSGNLLNAVAYRVKT
jgi:hypothetical protein